MLVHNPEGSQELYDRIRKQLDLEAPAGGILHVAGPSPNGGLACHRSVRVRRGRGSLPEGAVRPSPRGRRVHGPAPATAVLARPQLHQVDARYAVCAAPFASRRPPVSRCSQSIARVGTQAARRAPNRRDSRGSTGVCTASHVRDCSHAGSRYSCGFPHLAGGANGLHRHADTGIFAGPIPACSCGVPKIPTV